MMGYSSCSVDDGELDSELRDSKSGGQAEVNQEPPNPVKGAECPQVG